MSNTHETLAYKERRLRSKRSIGDWFIAVGFLLLAGTVGLSLSDGRTFTKFVEMVQKMSTAKK